MRAGFGTLRNNCIDAGLFQKPRFLDGGCGPHDCDISPLERRDLSRRGYAESKAENRRALFQNGVQLLLERIARHWR